MQDVFSYETATAFSIALSTLRNELTRDAKPRALGCQAADVWQ